MVYWTLLIHALPNTYAWGVLSERLVGILAGGQHSALVVVVTCFYSFEHSSPNLWEAVKPGLDWTGLDWILDWILDYVIGQCKHGVTVHV